MNFTRYYLGIAVALCCALPAQGQTGSAAVYKEFAETAMAESLNKRKEAVTGEQAVNVYREAINTEAQTDYPKMTAKDKESFDGARQVGTTYLARAVGFVGQGDRERDQGAAHYANGVTLYNAGLLDAAALAFTDSRKAYDRALFISYPSALASQRSAREAYNVCKAILDRY